MCRRYIILILVLTGMFITTSCGGLRNQSSIHAEDYHSDKQLTIKLAVKNAPNTSPSMHFAIAKNATDFSKMIEATDKKIATKIYQGKFISLQTESGIFLIEQIDKLDTDNQQDYRYYFFAPIGTFEANQTTDKFVQMYVPYHLIKGIAVQHFPDNENAIKTPLEYESYGTLEDFYDFYNKFEQCEVEKDQYSIIVTDKIKGTKLMLTFTQNDSKTMVQLKFL